MTAVPEYRTASNIVWDKDGEDVDLPTTVTDIPGDLEDDEVADWLSNEYGWCVECADLDEPDAEGSPS